MILAAGKGTRMKSDLHKVLHPIAGRAMLEHLLGERRRARRRRARSSSSARRASRSSRWSPRMAAWSSSRSRSWAPPMPCARPKPALAGFDGDVLILYGDTPFVERRDDARDARAAARRRCAGGGRRRLPARPIPKHYGRILAEPDGTIVKMVEYKDASEEERALDLCNSGLMAVRSGELWPLLARVGNDNAAGEYYLPDIVMIAAADGRDSAVIEVEPADEVEGINSRAELAAAEAAWQARRRAEAMADGVTLVAPETVWFAHDTEIGRDT